MRELRPAPEPPAIVQNEFARIQELFSRSVMPTYGRFDLALDRGEGNHVWDADGRRYLDLGGGIAVNSLGHSHPEITDALVQQSKKLQHVSNLYYTESQGRLAAELVRLIGRPGRVFFCNSGAEADEGLFKLARRVGQVDGRYEVITALNSFHGRTVAGIAATGQDKVKKGFLPMIPGFTHVPFNDLEAVRAAITPLTSAVLIEPIQGESGVTPATADYLLGLRRLCDEHNLLLLFDEVQGGHFRTGKFQSWQRILENVPGAKTFSPDGISMAKSLGGGFPIGAFWAREGLAEMFSPGTHGATYGGNPLACAVALRILEVIQRDHLAENARTVGDYILHELQAMVARFPTVLRKARGYGLMIGLEFRDDAAGFQHDKQSPAIQAVIRLHKAGVLTVPAALTIVRILPALTLTKAEAEEGLRLIERVVESFAT